MNVILQGSEILQWTLDKSNSLHDQQIWVYLFSWKMWTLHFCIGPSLNKYEKICGYSVGKTTYYDSQQSRITKNSTGGICIPQ